VTEINRDTRLIIARNLTRAREAAGYSKRRLAHEAGVGEGQLRKWEAGRMAPIAQNLIKIAHVLGQSLEWFYEDHDSEARDD
jgi:transcriptional regulator with XRE-family HTH domain